MHMARVKIMELFLHSFIQPPLVFPLLSPLFSNTPTPSIYELPSNATYKISHPYKTISNFKVCRI
jgi:hypothetical protein